MAQQHLNYGTTADDGTGDTLRSAASKIEANFNELYGAMSWTGKAVAAGGETALTVGSIPQGFTALDITFFGRTNNAATAADMLLTVNGNTSAIYSNQRAYWNNGSGGANAQNGVNSVSSLSPDCSFLFMAGDTAPANAACGGIVRINGYSNTSWYKTGWGESRLINPGPAPYLIMGDFEIALTSAITSVTLTAQSSTFKAGCFMTVRAI